MSEIKFSIHKKCPYCSFQKILANDYRNQTCINCGLKIMENGIPYDLIIEPPLRCPECYSGSIISTNDGYRNQFCICGLKIYEKGISYKDKEKNL